MNYLAKKLNFESIELDSFQRISQDFGIIIISAIFQCAWMSWFESTKVGLMNLLPTFIYLSIWYFFCKTQLKSQLERPYFWFFLLLGFSLTLRFPLVISRNLEPLSWITYLIMICLIFYKLGNYFIQKQRLLLFVITCLILLQNAFAHTSLNSPYSYVFRVRDGLTSAYSATADNYKTFECGYEDRDIVTSCDMFTYMDIEKILTDRDFNNAEANFYVRRFFYSYLSSLIGYVGHRWWAGFSLNLLLWLGACVAIFKSCLLFKFDKRVAAIAMLCCASSWGFIHLVGQPGPYVASYAMCSIMIWATLEILLTNNESRAIVFYVFLILSGAAIYDVYPVTLVCITALCSRKRYIPAACILISQILVAFLWRNVFLLYVLGTVGNQEGNLRVLYVSLNVWVDSLIHLDFNKILRFIGKGLVTFVYGGMVFGTIAGLVFIGQLIKSIFKETNEEIKENISLLLYFFVPFCVLIIATEIFITPELEHWTTLGFLPRLAFYTFPIFTIALATLSNQVLKRYAYIVPALTFIFANIDVTGLVSMGMFFDMGFVGVYWR
jgi:hypothetical protein